MAATDSLIDSERFTVPLPVLLDSVPSETRLPAFTDCGRIRFSEAS